MKPRKTLSVYVLLVGVLGLSIVGGVLAFQIFSAATRSQLTEAQAEIIKPIDGSIDQKVIDNLDKRKVVTEDEIALLSSVSLNTTTGTQTTPVLTPTQTATESAEQTATESAATNEQ